MTTGIRDEVRDFLTTRRAKVRPEDVGLPSGGTRRVPGLRRSEVATLAGVSVEYYSRVERGELAGVSDGILAAIGRALRLDESEQEHLADLARTANASPLARPRTRATAVRPGLHAVLGTITGGPALIRNARLDVLAANDLARALYADALDETPRLNLARFTFLQRHLSEAFHPDWHLAADRAVAVLRTEAGRDPHDRLLQDLVGELSTRSDLFRTLWGRHDVRTHGAGTKRFDHPVVGEVVLAYEELAITADPGQILMIYTAEPGSASAERLRLLSSWAATARLDA